MKIYVATGNEHKYLEIRRILSFMNSEFVKVDCEASENFDCPGKIARNKTLKAQEVLGDKLEGNDWMILAEDSFMEFVFANRACNFINCSKVWEDEDFAVEHIRHHLNLQQELDGEILDALTYTGVVVGCAVSVITPDVPQSIVQNVAYGHYDSIPAGDGWGFDNYVAIPPFEDRTMGQWTDEMKAVHSPRSKAIIRAVSDVLASSGE